MTIETEIAALTTATTDLLSAVNVRKATLDAAVDTSTTQAGIATTQAGIATTKADVATGSANAAAAAVVSQLTDLKTQTEYVRDQAIAGLGAADNSQALADLLGAVAYVTDMALKGVGQTLENRGTQGSTDRAEMMALALTRLGDLAGVTARAVAGGMVHLTAGTVASPALSASGDFDTGLYFPASDQLAVSTGGAQRLLIDSAGHHAAGADNTQTLGTASKRWSTVYAGTGTINTSDAREKTEIAPLTAAEIAAAKDLSREVGSYRFLQSIAAKGDAARTHLGLTVQRAIEILTQHGLEPFRYGFICHDSWPEITIAHPAIDAVLDDDGTVVTPASEAWTEIVQPAGDRYAFRYDQLNLFLSAGLSARLDALEISLGV